ncbi:MAG: hypothetical protein FWD76_02060 [Firmicutes bacterium]|nr:hypothetical protein [Bacillota bacterium]
MQKQREAQIAQEAENAKNLAIIAEHAKTLTENMQQVQVQFVYCSYCGAKNKVLSIKCTECGAVLPILDNHK